MEATKISDEMKELFSVFSEEDLIRFRWRLKRAKLYSTAELLGKEIKLREINFEPFNNQKETSK